MSVSRDSYCRCLYYSVNAFARKISRMAELEFEPTGLPPSLGFIVMTVNRKPGITAGEIASIMQLQPSTVTRFVDKLESGGFLTRHTNGKFMRAFPTAKATRLHEPLQAAWRNLYKRYTAILGATESKNLTAVIYKAGARLDAM